MQSLSLLWHRPSFSVAGAAPVSSGMFLSGATLAVLACATGAVAWAGSPVSLQTHYIRLGAQDTSVAIAADATGNIFVVSQTLGADHTPAIRVTKTDPAGNIAAVMDFAPGVSPSAATVDAQGNLLVVGNGLVAKLDNALANVLATANIPAHATAVTTDASGDVYVAGTAAADFPTTPGAFQASATPGAAYAFVAELSPDLGKIIAATLFGNYAADCYPNPNSCGKPASTNATAIALDPTGAVVIAGYTNTTPALLSTQPYNYGFVAKFSADLTSLPAQTVFNPVGNVLGQTYFRAMVLDSQGNPVLVGDGNDVGPLPGSNLQPNAPASSAGFVLKIDNALQNILWGTYFGAEYLGTRGVEGVATDAQGNLWVTGISRGSYLPSPTDTGLDSSPFVAELTSDGTAILDMVSSQFGGTAVAAVPAGGVAVLGPSDSFLLTASPDQPSLLMVASSANNVSSGTIAPGELLSLYGSGIGPQSPAGGVVVGGAFTTSLSGYQVLFNGVPAPLLYAGPNQFNVVAPAAIANQQTADIEILGAPAPVSFPKVFVAVARPQIFSQERTFVPQFSNVTETAIYAIAYNQDGTLNNDTNPAPRDSVVTLWATGTGLADNPLPDGAISTSAAVVNLPVVVSTASGAPLEVSYAGQAPGAIQGLTQINFRIPADASGYGLPFQFWIYLQLGDAASGLTAVEVTIK
jgi:uncharacterized protein (TIGR03437 family)